MSSSYLSQSSSLDSALDPLFELSNIQVFVVFQRMAHISAIPSHSFPDIVPPDALRDGIRVVEFNGNMHFLAKSSMVARRKLIRDEKNASMLETRHLVLLEKRLV